MIKRRAYVDFETMGIEKRPDFPPAPVGVAIIDGRMKKYFAWGHPEENNCTKREAVRVLKKVYANAKNVPVCFHNAAFDLEVGTHHLNLRMLDTHEFEDTLFLAFLHDPRDPTFSLKPLSDKYLNMPPEEQDILKEWLVKNIRTEFKGGEGAVKRVCDFKGAFTWGYKIPPTKAGAFIAYAPGKMVGKYAVGDVVRTKGLFEKFYPHTVNNGMEEAYIREKKLLPIVKGMEQQGVKINKNALGKDLKVREVEIAKIDKLIRRKLGDINLNSGAQLSKALYDKGYVEEFEYTEKGNPKTGRESLQRVCNNKLIVSQLDRLSRLNKIVGTYMRPWHESAVANNGYFYPWFSQTKDSERPRGTKTGRFSSNFQQVPRKPTDKTLPFMRSYVVRDNANSILLNRDYSQQELRILAHFEDGDLLQMYLDNPKTDMHEEVNKMIQSVTGLDYGRPKVKAVNFSTIYGAGRAAISADLKITMEATKKLLAAHERALPGLKSLKKELVATAEAGDPIYTLGGRMYYCEEPRIINGRERTWEYKMLNLLIQGSAADHTKEGMIRIYERLTALHGDDWRFVLTVHDEFMLNVVKGKADQIMANFKDAMNFDFLDVPMLSDGKKGISWGTMKKTKI